MNGFREIAGMSAGFPPWGYGGGLCKSTALSDTGRPTLMAIVASGVPMKSCMKNTLLLSVLPMLLAGWSASVSAQQIYRCVAANGGAPEYINNTKDAQTRNCKPMSGGNVTIVQGSPVPKAPSATPSPVRLAGAGPSSGGPEQRARDSDSRAILEAELRKAEAQLAAQQKEYNNGEPEKQGIEGRNYQRYLDRVSEMKDNIIRSESDIAGLKREISRLPVVN